MIGDTSGHRSLWASVIARAVIDANYSGTDKLEKAERDRALWWFEQAGRDYQKVCALAGMDAASVRRVVLEGAANLDSLTGNSYASASRPRWNAA